MLDEKDVKLIDSKIELLKSKKELLDIASDKLKEEIEDYRRLYLDIDEKLHLLFSVLEQINKGLK